MRNNDTEGMIIAILFSIAVGIIAFLMIYLPMVGMSNKEFQNNPIQIISTYQQTPTQNYTEPTNNSVTNTQIDKNNSDTPNNPNVQKISTVGKVEENGKYYLFIKENADGEITKIETTKEQYENSLLTQNQEGGN